jgi:hypothetical protein
MVRRLQQLLRLESASGLVPMAATAMALVVVTRVTDLPNDLT